MEGHCRHCDERICVVLYAGLTEHADISGARWYAICPACAEAERIAGEIDQTITPKVSDRVADGLAWAAAIARGKA